MPKITDAMLLEHAAKARDIWLNTLPADEDIPEIATSKAFERGMRKLIKRQRRPPGMARPPRRIKRAAATALIAAVLFLAMMMTVEASRTKVIEVVVHVFHELTDYRFSSDIAKTGETALPELSFGYVPEGMEEVEDRRDVDDSRYILYESGGSFFELTQQAVYAGGSYELIVDTENSTCEVFTLDGGEAYANTKGSDSSILWTRENITYFLYGNIDLQELKAIAEKIKISDT